MSCQWVVVQSMNFLKRKTPKSTFWCRFWCKFRNLLIFSVVCGERGIRTPGTSQYNGFQDRRIRPLCHLSLLNKFSIKYSSGELIYAVWTGLEPATPCVTGMYSNQLNYQTKFSVLLLFL